MELANQIAERLQDQGLQTSGQQRSTRTFDDKDQALVSWFFSMMRTAWGAAKYNSQFGEGDDVRFAKRYWAPDILRFNRGQLSRAFEVSNRERIAGNHKFEWPDIPAILSIAQCDWEHRRLENRPPPRARIESDDSRAHRMEYGRKQIAQLRQLTGI